MASNGADHMLRLARGRALGFRVYGDPAGTPLLFLHGTPGSRLKFSIGHEAGRALKLAIIAPDRWGYGLSDVPPEATLSAYAGDMAALMDHLGHKRFAVGGISGGGPYAAAVAALLPSRVTSLALISPVGPIADAACAASLPRMQRFCFTVLPRRPRAIAAAFGIFRITLKRAPRLATQLATFRGGRLERQMMQRPEICERLLGSFREGLRPGMAGPVTDLALFSRAWGIDLADIAAPARVWIGTRDTVVPLVAARALARRITTCDLEELDGEGHLWVAANYGRVLEWIATSARASAAAI